MNRIGKNLSAPVRIITVHWNAYDHTARLLDKLTSLRYPNFDTVVVDNASTDGSRERLQQNYPQITFLRMDNNAGFGAANNAALRQALQDDIPYAWLINNDALPDEHALNDLVNTLENEPRAGVCGSLVFHQDRPDTLQARGGGRVFSWLGYAQLQTAKETRTDFITGTSMLLRLDALRDIGLFDETYFLYWEDADLCYRMQQAGWHLATSNGRVMHATSSSTKNNMKNRSFHILRSFTLFAHTHYPTPFARSLCAMAFQSAGKAMRGYPGAALGAWQGWRAGLKIMRLKEQC